MHLSAFSGNKPCPPGGDGSAVTSEDRVFGKAFPQFVSEMLWLHRLVEPASMLQHRVVPLFHAALSFLDETTILVVRQHRQEFAQRPSDGRAHDPFVQAVGGEVQHAALPEQPDGLLLSLIAGETNDLQPVPVEIPVGKGAGRGRWFRLCHRRCS